MSPRDTAIEQAVQSLACIDAFHSPDPVEALEAVFASVDGWKELVLRHPDALATLLALPNGPSTMANSISVISACVARVMQELTNRQLLDSGLTIKHVSPGGGRSGGK